jgi:hypothetical protein
VGLAYQMNVTISGGGARRDIQYNNNYSYLTPSYGGGNNTLSEYTPGGDMTAKDNVFAGGYATLVMNGEGGPFTFTGNKLYHEPNVDLFMVMFGLSAGQTTASYNWDHNEYYGGGGYRTDSSSCTDFNTFRSQTGFDHNSTFSASKPSSQWVYVRPNKYEPGRANITIFNWPKAATVAVDLSTALSAGDMYEVRDVQNWYATTPVLTGTYSGGTVSIPMTGLTKGAFISGPHTAPELGTFVVMKTGTGSVGVYGDANGDGAFGMADINQVVDWLLGRSTAPAAGAAAFTRSDVNGDGVLSMADLNLFVDKILGRITKFPIEQ